MQIYKIADFGFAKKINVLDSSSKNKTILGT